MQSGVQRDGTAQPRSARGHGPGGGQRSAERAIKSKATSGAALTDGDQLDALPLQELEGDGDVLQLHLAEGGPLVVLAVHALLAEHLEQRDQPQPVAQVVLQVADALVDAAQVLIAPTGEGVLLDPLPGRVLRQVLLGGRHLAVGIGRSAPALAPRLRAHGAAPLRPRRRRSAPGPARPRAARRLRAERGRAGRARRSAAASRLSVPPPRCSARPQMRCVAPLPSLPPPARHCAGPAPPPGLYPAGAARPRLHHPPRPAGPGGGAARGRGGPGRAGPRRGGASAGPYLGVRGERRDDPRGVTRGRGAAPVAPLRGRGRGPHGVKAGPGVRPRVTERMAGGAALVALMEVRGCRTCGAEARPGAASIAVTHGLCATPVAVTHGRVRPHGANGWPGQSPVALLHAWGCSPYGSGTRAAPRSTATGAPVVFGRRPAARCRSRSGPPVR